MRREQVWILGLLAALGCRSHRTAAPRAPRMDAAVAAGDPAERAVENGLLPGITVSGADVGLGIGKRMAHYGVPAVGVAVISGGKLAWAHTWGTLEQGQTGSADTATRFQAASISKPVTAVAILRLVEQGKLELDGEVGRYLRSWQLPALPAGRGPVTIRQLLSHTAGLNAPEQEAYFRFDGSFAGYAPGAPLPTTAQILSGAPPAISAPVAFLSPAPAGFSYSGGGYTVLQQVIEDVTGKPFAEALQELVLTPAGMTHSTFAHSPGTANAAHAHAAGGAPVAGGWIVIPEAAVGGLWTTPSDLALLVADLMGAYQGEAGHLLSPATAKLMLTPITSSRPLIAGSIGLGMFVSDDGGELYFSHNGHNPGFHASMVGLPARGQGLVVMTNREDGAQIMGEVANAVATVYDWPARAGMRPRVRTSAVVPAAVIASYAGTYQGLGLKAVVRADGDRLLVRIDQGEEARLYPLAQTDFFEPWGPFVLKFAVDGAKATVAYDSPTAQRSATREQ